MEKRVDLLIIGGGAAGIFAAIEAKRSHPEDSVLVLEKSAVLLSKVRISGGGRCNVTHACFDPLALSKNYPRGGNELIGPFHRFGPTDTIAWFEQHGVKLKTESDGRMFPTTDSSETIIHCLLDEAKKLGVEIALRQKVEQIVKTDEGFIINQIKAHRLLLATGSSPQGYEWAKQLGHTIQEPIPSLFTFNIPSSPLLDLSGVSLIAELKIAGTALSQTGPLLLTHFGFSGPAAIKLSAWAARELYAKNYRVDLVVNWLPKLSCEDIYQALLQLKNGSENVFYLPKNLWKHFVGDRKMKDFSNKDLRKLAEKLHADVYKVEGKTTNKEEFVTCGGVTLSEVNFQTMESKICPGLFFAGEILNIDGVTGGFNFQNAWTTGFIAGQN
ncbi:MAG: NAD(P)/FAD-dependent oxidoreductase [Verrucomicrobia bacterium]|nr:NAD(P)/FAD-dependent oxidoreductase [Verrucomicrobiota bacterium]